MLGRLVIFIQLPLALAILAWLPSSVAKLTALLVLWAITFRHLSRSEWLFGLTVCVFFTGMNAASLSHGIFAFTNPDVLGMPVYELFMWGFYLLHTRRLLGGPVPQGRVAAVGALAVLYSAAFATIPSANLLLGVTACLLLVGLTWCHEPYDLAYVGYMVLLGAAIEYTGVHAGQWTYPGHPPGGVPLWFITLWGGVGLFLRRLAVPALERVQDRRALQKR